MLLYLLAAFTVIPAVELLLLFYVHSLTSLSTTIAIILVTGIIGSSLARRQGMHAWLKIRQALEKGRMPTDELMHGFLIMISGVLLVTPGILTDIVGFLLLLPAFRVVLGNWLAGFLKRKFTPRVVVHPASKMGASNSSNSPDEASSDDIIDVQAKVSNDE